MGRVEFRGRVAVVTGGGGGLGRAHALLLASRGAAVVVNDLGGGLDGVGGDNSAARRVADEIIAAGGSAMASHDDISTVRGAEQLIEDAVSAYGRVDVLINNAGILRDRTLAKMAPADFEAVLKVHLHGSVWCTRAAWSHMQHQRYGRIVMTTSAAGLYGNFGQSNYGAAKLALVGLMNSLKHEGARHGILVNAIAPVAMTRMTGQLGVSLPLEDARPESVSAGVAFLASEACDVSGQILSAGAGYFALARMVESRGIRAANKDVAPEFVADNWKRIADTAGERTFGSALEAIQVALSQAGR